MNSFAEYLVKSGVSLAILYFFYWLLLRKDTHFKLNRFVLVFSLLGSLLVPFVNIYLIADQKLQSNLPMFYASLDDIVIKATPVHTGHSVNWFKIVTFVYVVGCLLVLARLIYQGIYLHVMSRLSKTIRKGNFTIVLMDADMTPFAYFNKIFIPASKADDYSVEAILAHERSHLEQYHFVDLFLVELVTVFQWFNPIVWLYERSFKEVHEYLADESVLHRGQNKGVYQALLVNQAMGGPVFSLTNQFNQSLIKKRIVMMTKMKTPRLAQLKALLVVPLVLLLLFAFANPKTVVKPIVQKGNELLSTIAQPSGKASDEAAKNSEISTSVQLKDTVKTEKDSKVISDEDVPLQYVEQMPEFPGGQNEMMKFISKNIKYPQEALKKQITGRVIVQFIVDHVGNTKKVKVLRGINGGCDEEAVRVVKLFPPWKPGRDHGKDVSVYFTLPIVFNLTDENKNKQSSKTVENDSKPVQYAEQMPQYPGGVDSMMRFLSTHIKYPKEAVEKNITGRVILQFLVDKNGKVVNPKVLRGIGGGCDEEALRVVNLMPEWKPGVEKGKAVNVYFTLPIAFSR